jgi:hypothetical protein
MTVRRGCQCPLFNYFLASVMSNLDDCQAGGLEPPEALRPSLSRPATAKLETN